MRWLYLCLLWVWGQADIFTLNGTNWTIFILGEPCVLLPRDIDILRILQFILALQNKILSHTWSQFHRWTRWTGQEDKEKHVTHFTKYETYV